MVGSRTVRCLLCEAVFCNRNNLQEKFQSHLTVEHGAGAGAGVELLLVASLMPAPDLAKLTKQLTQQYTHKYVSSEEEPEVIVLDDSTIDVDDPLSGIEYQTRGASEELSPKEKTFTTANETEITKKDIDPVTSTPLPNLGLVKAKTSRFNGDLSKIQLNPIQQRDESMLESSAEDTLVEKETELTLQEISKKKKLLPFTSTPLPNSAQNLVLCSNLSKIQGRVSQGKGKGDKKDFLRKPADLFADITMDEEAPSQPAPGARPVHRGVTIREFRCTLCGKIFPSSNRRSTHKRVACRTRLRRTADDSDFLYMIT